jgi:anti-sigma regulatory factor (Ser/Thr protein kinase)
MTDDSHHQPQQPGRNPSEPTTGTSVPGADVVPILNQEFDAGSLYALRETVAAHTTQAGMPESRAGDIVLAVHELAVNAIRHGAGHGRLLIKAYGGALHCQVIDDGTPHAAAAGAGLEALATSPGDAPWLSQHGHGLWFVRQIADQVSLHTGPDGTIAVASFTLPNA